MDHLPVQVCCWLSWTDNYFNGGARYRKEFDEALDNYLLKVLKYNPTILSVVRFQYTDWSSGKPDADYKRGDVSISLRAQMENRL